MQSSATSQPKRVDVAVQSDPVPEVLNVTVQLNESTATPAVAVSSSAAVSPLEYVCSMTLPLTGMIGRFAYSV